MITNITPRATAGEVRTSVTSAVTIYQLSPLFNPYKGNVNMTHTWQGNNREISLGRAKMVN